MFSLLLQNSCSVEYSLSATELKIFGQGEINKKGVTSKGSVSKVIRVLIEDGPYKIDKESFFGMESLEYVKISKSVSLIVEQPFAECGKLSKIVVDPANTNFYNDDNFALYAKSEKILIRAPTIKDIVIAEGIQKIESYSFRAKRYNYGNVVFPSSISSLCTDAFYDSVFTSIAFRSVSQLTELCGIRYAKIDTFNVPPSVTYIAKNAFYSSIVTTILFEENSKLEEIREYAFEKLKCSSISLPDSLQTIGNYSFKESTLTTINIGSGCSKISSSAFVGCDKLTNIIISESNTFYNSKDNIMMNADSTEILFIPPNSESLKIPKTVTKLGKTLLQSSKQLTTIILEDGDTNWDTNNGVLYTKGFRNIVAVCGGISKVDAHQNVEEVNAYASFGCLNLTSFSFLGNLVAKFGDYSFANTGLTSFDLPNTVTQIGIYAFYETPMMRTFNMEESSPLDNIPYYCFCGSALKSFTVGKNVQTLVTGSFFYCRSMKEIIFPAGSKIAVIQDYSFENAALTNVIIPSTVTTIHIRAFQFCLNLETVVFAEQSKLTTIKELSFSGCTSLWKVVLPKSCTTLEPNSFVNCNALTSFTHNLETIGNSAFENCTSLENFNFSSRQLQVSLNPSIFKNCIKIISFNVDKSNAELKDLNGSVYNVDKTILYLFPPGREIAKIPPETIEFAALAFAWSAKLKFVAFFSDSNLATIGETAFYECKKLTTVQFPAKLITIKAECFYGCSSLKSIFLPSSLTFIEEGSFLGCIKLRSVKYCGTKEIQGSNVFEEHAVILVTDLYPTTELCSKKVFTKLSFDCEIKSEFAPTCGHSYNFSLISTLFISLFIYRN